MFSKKRKKCLLRLEYWDIIKFVEELSKDINFGRAIVVSIHQSDFCTGSNTWYGFTIEKGRSKLQQRTDLVG